MPRCAGLNYVRQLKRPASAQMQDMLFGCQRDARIKDEELANRLNMTASGVRHKRGKGIDTFRLEEVKAWANAIGVPSEDFAKAFQMYLEK